MRCRRDRGSGRWGGHGHRWCVSLFDRGPHATLQAVVICCSKRVVMERHPGEDHGDRSKQRLDPNESLLVRCKPRQDRRQFRSHTCDLRGRFLRRDLAIGGSPKHMLNLAELVRLELTERREDSALKLVRSVGRLHVAAAERAGSHKGHVLEGEIAAAAPADQPRCSANGSATHAFDGDVHIDGRQTPAGIAFTTLLPLAYSDTARVRGSTSGRRRVRRRRRAAAVRRARRCVAQTNAQRTGLRAPRERTLDVASHQEKRRRRRRSRGCFTPEGVTSAPWLLGTRTSHVGLAPGVAPLRGSGSLRATRRAGGCRSASRCLRLGGLQLAILSLVPSHRGARLGVVRCLSARAKRCLESRCLFSRRRCAARLAPRRAGRFTRPWSTRAR